MFNSILESVLLEFDLRKTVDMLGGVEKFRNKIDNDDSLGDRKFFYPKLDSDKWFDKNGEAIQSELRSIDPTTNQSYSRWIIQMYMLGGINQWEDMGRVNNALTLFDGFKHRKLTGDKSDIFRFKSLVALEDFVEELEYEHGDQSKRADNAALAAKMRDEAEIWEYPGVTVVKPHTKEASCYFGKGTRWCTAADKNNLFKQYTRGSGSLYIFIPKKPLTPRAKFQIFKGAKDFYVMDERDSPVKFSELSREYPEFGEPIRDIFGVDIDNNNKFHKIWGGWIPEDTLYRLDAKFKGITTKWPGLLDPEIPKWIKQNEVLLQSLGGEGHFDKCAWLLWWPVTLWKKVASGAWKKPLAEEIELTYTNIDPGCKMWKVFASDFSTKSGFMFMVRHNRVGWFFSDDQLNDEVNSNNDIKLMMADYLGVEQKATGFFDNNRRPFFNVDFLKNLAKLSPSNQIAFSKFVIKWCRDSRNIGYRLGPEELNAFLKDFRGKTQESFERIMSEVSDV